MRRAAAGLGLLTAALIVITLVVLTHAVTDHRITLLATGVIGAVTGITWWVLPHRRVMGTWLRVLEALLAVAMGMHGVAGYIAASVNHDDHLRATYEAVILGALLVAVGAGFTYGYPIIPCVSLWIAGLIGFGAGTSGVDPGYVYGVSGVVLSGCSMIAFIMQQRRLHREN